LADITAPRLTGASIAEEKSRAFAIPDQTTAGTLPVGVATSLPDPPSHPDAKPEWYALVPLLAVQLADVMFFSWTTPDPGQAAAPAVLPSNALSPGGGTLGLSGRF
jgi:hypothetical protein